LELLLLLPPLLNSTQPISREEFDILFSTQPLSNLQSLLPELGPLVSANLLASATSLARIANPTTNPSFLHRSVPSLAQTMAALQASVEADKADLIKERAATATSLISLLQKYSQALTLLVRSLEGKHGMIARSLELQAAEVALMAQRGEIEAQMAKWNIHKEVYTPEMVTVLKNYNAHLRDVSMQLEDQIQAAKIQLEGYGVGIPGGENKERTMREMARVFREMSREIGEVNSDLERLERG
jgi:hypothetical protein